MQAFSAGCDHGVTTEVAAGAIRRGPHGAVPAAPAESRCRARAATALIHDEGDAVRVQNARKARRAGSAGSAFGTGSLRRPARLLIEDPMPKNSTHSYFLQHADLAARRRSIIASPSFRSDHPNERVLGPASIRTGFLRTFADCSWVGELVWPLCQLEHDDDGQGEHAQ